MTNQENPQGPGNDTPVFRLQKLYVKDLSFENPNAPDVFLGTKMEPKIEVNLNLNNRKMDEDHWEVTLGITANVNSKEGKTMFIVEVEHAGLFLLKNIPEQHLATVLAVDCPTMLLPFTRQIISQVSVDGGFIPFLMEPVNFLALYQNSQKQNAQQQ